jgi:sulfate adenylyltransferase subunit 1 (EFTu-like GTPase family)
VTIRLEDDPGASRGDMICRPRNAPAPTQVLDSMVCWMNDRPLVPGARYAVKHTTRTVHAHVEELQYAIDVNTLHRRQGVKELALNDVGRVRIDTEEPLLVDDYRRSRATGSFILIDETTGETVGAGMVLDKAA